MIVVDGSIEVMAALKTTHHLLQHVMVCRCCDHRFDQIIMSDGILYVPVGHEGEEDNMIGEEGG